MIVGIGVGHPFQQFQSEIISNGLVALYNPLKQYALGQAGQTLIDYSGNSNNGQLGSIPVQDTTDPIFTEQGLRFDGIDDYVQLPKLLPANGDFTILIAGVTLDNGYVQDLVTQWVSGEAGRMILSVNVVKKFALYLGGSLRCESATVVAGGNYLMSCKRQVNTFSLYVNDKKEAENASSLPLSQTTTKLGSYGSGEYLNGKEHLILVYNRALTDNEISQNYSQIKKECAKYGIAI